MPIKTKNYQTDNTHTSKTIKGKAFRDAPGEPKQPGKTVLKLLY